VKFTVCTNFKKSVDEKIITDDSAIMTILQQYPFWADTSWTIVLTI